MLIDVSADAVFTVEAIKTFVFVANTIGVWKQIPNIYEYRVQPLYVGRLFLVNTTDSTFYVRFQGIDPSSMQTSTTSTPHGLTSTSSHTSTRRPLPSSTRDTPTYSSTTHNTPTYSSTTHHTPTYSSTPIVYPSSTAPAPRPTPSGPKDTWVIATCSVIGVILIVLVGLLMYKLRSDGRIYTLHHTLSIGNPAFNTDTESRETVL